MTFELLKENFKHEFNLVPRDNYKIRFHILIKDMRNSIEKGIELLLKYDVKAGEYYKKMYDYFIYNDYLYMLLDLHSAIQLHLYKVEFKRYDENV